METPTATAGISSFVSTEQQQSGLLSTSLDFDILQIQDDHLDVLLPNFLSDVFSRPAIAMKRSSLKEVTCLYCKKEGHMIRSCRYKRRRDKLRDVLASLAELPSTGLLENIASCPEELPSLGLHTVIEEMDDSLLSPSEKLLSCKSDGIQVKDTNQNLVYENICVIEYHSNDPSHEPMTCSSFLSILKWTSISWIFSLAWAKNPFCLERCKRELWWLCSFMWLIQFISLIQRKMKKRR